MDAARPDLALPPSPRPPRGAAGGDPSRCRPPRPPPSSFILRTKSSALETASFGLPMSSSGTVPDWLAKLGAFPLTTPGVVISDMDESL